MRSPSPKQILLVVGWLILLSIVISAQSTTRPNVLLIMTDDQGYGDFSLHGNQHLKTPVLDRFAREGVQFSHFYVSPLCAPTRASLLTGRYHLRTGVWGVTHSKETMRSEELTIAEALKSAGYKTGLFGKWHNGEQYPYIPTGQGFDEFIGFNNGHWNNYFDATLLRRTSFVKTKGYITDLLTDETLKFIESNQAQPFFAYVAYNAPHSPFQVLDKYFDKFKQMGLDDTLASVYAMCENIDDNVGRLVAKLDELKLRDNTLVIFLTDNGASTERYNAGMRGRKGSVHEGGSRVPLFLQYPNVIKAPKIIDEIAAHIDLMPTILELCKVNLKSVPQFDGLSLFPLLNDAKLDWPARILFTHNNGSKEVQLYPGAARSQRYRLVNEGKEYELYDMKNDPSQQKNIAGEHPELVKQMSQEYERWFQDVSRQGFTRLPIQLGHEKEDSVIIYAPQAELRGNARFFEGNGWANDWITNFAGADAEISWPLEILAGGRYEIIVSYRNDKAPAKNKIQINVGNAIIAAALPPTAATPDITLPDRVPRKEAPERVWSRVKVGALNLYKGQTRLLIKSLAKAGQQGLEIKAITLSKLK